jgi:hypothetical protein
MKKKSYLIQNAVKIGNTFRLEEGGGEKKE